MLSQGEKKLINIHFKKYTTKKKSNKLNGFNKYLKRQKEEKERERETIITFFFFLFLCVVLKNQYNYFRLTNIQCFYFYW